MSLSTLAQASVVAVAGVTLVVIYKRITHKSPYKHITGPPASSWLGFLPDLHHPDALNWHLNMSVDYGHVARLDGGLIGKDALYISDPLALHTILVRDQYTFPESREFSGLFGLIHHGDSFASAAGQDHKKLRKTINPVFTAYHVSKLVPMFYDIADELNEKLAAAVSTGKTTVDIFDYLTRTALELVAQGGLGHTFNSFDRDSKEFDECHGALKSILPNASRIFFALPFFETWRKMEPKRLRRLLAKLVPFIPYAPARDFKSGIETLHRICVDIFQENKQAFLEAGIERIGNTKSTGRKDLISLLIQRNTELDEEDRMTDKTITAHMSAILTGAQETTSAVLSRLLTKLAEDSVLQEQLREEILAAKAKHGERLDYQQMNELPILDATIREAVRLFAPVNFVWRRTNKDIVVPLEFPIYDKTTGVERKEVLIEEGTSVYVGQSALNLSPAVWGEDAAKFRVDRWTNAGTGEHVVAEGSTGVRTPGVYSQTLSFLAGGRSCPGMKFAVLQLKLVLTMLIANYALEPSTEKIDWKVGITMTPYVEGREKEGPMVPLIMSKVKRS